MIERKKRLILTMVINGNRVGYKFGANGVAPGRNLRARGGRGGPCMTDHEHKSYVSHSTHNRNADSYMLFPTLHHVYRKVENNTIH